MAKATNPAFRLLDDPDEQPGARVRRVGGLILWAETLAFRTRAAREFINVTDQVAAVVERSGVTQGWVSVFSKHTTATVVLNENEPLLLADFARFLEQIAPAGAYDHDDMARRVHVAPDEPRNGHAHCRQLLLSTSETVPVDGGRLELGRWQRIFLVELCSERPREVTVQVIGS